MKIVRLYQDSSIDRDTIRFTYKPADESTKRFIATHFKTYSFDVGHLAYIKNRLAELGSLLLVVGKLAPQHLKMSEAAGIEFSSLLRRS